MSPREDYPQPSEWAEPVVAPAVTPWSCWLALAVLPPAVWFTAALHLPYYCWAGTLVLGGMASLARGPRACVMGVCAPALALVPALRARTCVRVGGGVWVACTAAAACLWLQAPGHAGTRRWVLAGALTLVLLGACSVILWRWHPSRRTVPDVSSDRGAGGLARWRDQVAGRWPAAAVAGGLVRTVPVAGGRTVDADGRLVDTGGQPDTTGVVDYARIDGPVLAVPGGAAWTVDLEPAARVAEDVVAAAPAIRREIGARLVLAEPEPHRDDRVMVHAFRAHPFYDRQPPSWRTLRPVPDSMLVPVGLTAFTDPSGTVRQAVLSRRGSTLIVSASDMGKSGLVRAYLRGWTVQQVPFALFVSDPKGDFGSVREVCALTGGRYVTSPADTEAMLAEVNAIGDSRYATIDGRYEHEPTLAAPAVVVVVGEWLEFIRHATRAAVELAERVVWWHRAAAISLLTTAQLAQQKQLGQIRDLFQHAVVLRVRYPSHTEMALGEDAVRRGAAAHEIPTSGKGWLYYVDQQTGWPVLAWAAWIPPEDQDEALVEPIRRMAARLHTQVDQADITDIAQRW